MSYRGSPNSGRGVGSELSGPDTVSLSLLQNKQFYKTRQEFYQFTLAQDGEEEFISWSHDNVLTLVNIPRVERRNNAA